MHFRRPMLGVLAAAVAMQAQTQRRTEEKFTAEMFQTPIRGKVRRVLTLKEAHERTHELISITEVMPRGSDRMEGVRFYTNDHCFGLGPDSKRVLPANFVPCSISLGGRRTIAPRPGFESGRLENASDEIRFSNHCEPDQVVIETLDQLVDYLNAHYTLADLEKE